MPQHITFKLVPDNNPFETWRAAYAGVEMTYTTFSFPSPYNP